MEKNERRMAHQGIITCRSIGIIIIGPIIRCSPRVKFRGHQISTNFFEENSKRSMAAKHFEGTLGLSKMMVKGREVSS